MLVHVLVDFWDACERCEAFDGVRTGSCGLDCRPGVDHGLNQAFRREDVDGGPNEVGGAGGGIEDKICDVRGAM